MKRWKKCPENSNWGRFGEDDECGTLNYIGAAERLAAAREIQEGIAFCLSLPLDIPGKVSIHPRRKPPRLQPTFLGDTPYINFPLDHVDPGLRDVISDDQVLLSTQYSTQWDSLAHVGALFDVDDNGTLIPCYYNGFRAGTDIEGQTKDGVHGSYARHLSVAGMAVAGIQGRGVLVDLVKAFGTGRTIVGLQDLTNVMRTQRVELRRGDILVLHTGYTEAMLNMQDNPSAEALDHCGAVLDGTDEALLRWLGDSKIAAIAADNYAVENPNVERSCGCYKLPLHHHCLFKLGLPLAELWYLRDLAEALAARQRTAFFLTAPPLRLPGAIGSPVTPIATI